MKLHRNMILSVKYLRTGLFVACFLAVTAAVSACGASEEKLLSELRREEEVPDDSASEPAESNGPDEAPDEENEESNADGGDGLQGQMIYVHVCGAVKKPGVYGLPAGSRFYEAVEEAGGFTEDACEDYLNMAAPLADGSRLEIPASEEIRLKEASEDAEEKPEGKAVGSADKSFAGNETAYSYYTLAEEKGGASDDGDAEGGLVNINTADIEGLCRLPGVGESRAKAIIEYRNRQGGFQKKEDIMQVSGIGEKMYARMEEYLAVE